MTFFSKINSIWREESGRIELRSMAKNIDKDYSLFSNNCTAGIIQHDLGLRLNSPTVDSLFSRADFLKYAENLKYYSRRDLKYFDVGPCFSSDSKTGKSIIASLGDVRIEFIHDDSFDGLLEKWERRTARINWDKIAVLAYFGRDVPVATRKEFAQLPYERKCLFLIDQKPMNAFEFRIPSKEKLEESRYALFAIDPTTGLRYYYSLDISHWLHTGVVRPLSRKRSLLTIFSTALATLKRLGRIALQNRKLLLVYHRKKGVLHD